MSMKYVDEFRDPEKAKFLSDEIAILVDEIVDSKQRPLQLMEFCGGHTHTIFRYGIEQLLPRQIELINGPGCPVCVLTQFVWVIAVRCGQSYGANLPQQGSYALHGKRWIELRCLPFLG